MKWIVFPLLAAMMWTGSALAHPPNVMAKDGCHADRKAGVRHYHRTGRTSIAGLCGANGAGPVALADDLGTRVTALEQAVKELNERQPTSACQIAVAKLSGAMSGWGDTRTVRIALVRAVEKACLK